MEGLMYTPSPTHFLHGLHHNNSDGVDVISRRNQVNPSSLAGGNTTNLGFYIGEPDLFEWHHLAMPNILPIEMKERTFSIQILKYPHSPVDPAQWIESKTTTVEALDLRGRISEMKEAKAAPQDIQSVLKWVPHPSLLIHPVEALDLRERISEMKEAKAAHQAELRICEAAVAIQSKVRQTQAALQHRNATITSSKQQGLPQVIIPKTHAGKVSEKSLRPEQNKLGKSCQSETSTSSGESCQSGESRLSPYCQSEQNNLEKSLRYASPAEPRRVNGHTTNDNMPKVSAKQRGIKSDSKQSNDSEQRHTRKDVIKSSTSTSSASTYFTGGFEPEAGTVFSSKTKSGPEQSNDIGSGKAEHVNHISGLNTKKGTSKSQLMAVSKTFNNNKDVKLQPNEDPLHFGFELHATRVTQRDGPSDGHRGGGRNGGRGKFNRGGRGNPGARGNRRGRGEVSQAGKKQKFSGCHQGGEIMKIQWVPLGN